MRRSPFIRDSGGQDTFRNRNENGSCSSQSRCGNCRDLYMRRGHECGVYAARSRGLFVAAAMGCGHVHAAAVAFHLYATCTFSRRQCYSSQRASHGRREGGQQERQQDDELSSLFHGHLQATPSTTTPQEIVPLACVHSIEEATCRGCCKRSSRPAMMPAPV